MLNSGMSRFTCPEGLRLKGVLALAILDAASIQSDIPPSGPRTPKYLSAVSRAQVTRTEAGNRLSVHVIGCPDCKGIKLR